MITPEWPAPAGVHALCTTRAGGVSAPPYDSLNLGDHVGDDPQVVQANRQRLQAARLPVVEVGAMARHPIDSSDRSQSFHEQVFPRMSVIGTSNGEGFHCRPTVACARTPGCGGRPRPR